MTYNAYETKGKETMCLINLNTTVLFCKDVTDDDTLVGVFDHISPDTIGAKSTVSFAMLVSLSALLPKTGEQFGNEVRYVDRDTCYDVKVRLTHIDTALGFDIDSFVFSTHQYNHYECRDVCELKRFIHIDNLDLTYGSGEYVVKVFVKKQEPNAKWTVQTIHRLMIN